MQAIIRLFGGSWLAMLAIGNAHSYDARIPALGYLVTLAIMFAIALAADVFRQDTAK